jgi:ElaB/YqjD/DUF883 family membrane-anchored ribosome-binding protein
MTYGKDLSEQESEELRMDIERTRARMAEDVEAIGEKLSPDNLKHEAKQAFSREVNQRTAAVRSRVRHASESVIGPVRANPIPFALIGLGVGWLLIDARRRSNGSEEAELPLEYAENFGDQGFMNEPVGYVDEPGFGEPSARERVESFSARAKERAHGMSDAARRRASALQHRARKGALHARDGARNMLHENPMAMGAAALAAGLGIGLLLPTTARENRLFGERRDQLLDAAKAKAHEVGEVASEAARRAATAAKDSAKQTVQSESERRGLKMPGGASAEQHHQSSSEDVAVSEVRSVGESRPAESFEHAENGRRI